MEKLKRLQKNDKVAIVSLSSGILGESFVKHELDLGEKRLKEFGLVPVYMKNSLKGLDFISNHPEARAEDLIDAFENPEIKERIIAKIKESIASGAAEDIVEAEDTGTEE